MQSPYYGQGPQADSQPPDYYPMASQPAKKRKKNKKRKNGSGGSPRGPQIRVQKRPKSGGMNPAFYDFDTQNDLHPSATFNKWKYPWLYRPPYVGNGNDPFDDDEEEGETEVNIRFFNNFSRMGPFGGLSRVGGTATLVVSLAFLIISNVSLAATVIAHGLSSLLRNLSQNPERNRLTSRKRETTPSPQARHRSMPANLLLADLTAEDIQASANETFLAHSDDANTTTTMKPTVLDERIRLFGNIWKQ